ncbi:peptide chain release factor N(5)-glutamine methyltransferase [Alicyclobacillus sendaiensis]|uniref:peptide chain release factor N(5)-glutamine methyltransferase n=1 Tax=Alicyclobacillus sendaiensis TaxID=192387 RepID=UPI0007861DBF|nr:peptide chain release factor N(5)-glutamine methyltransferase [Alicyclobacillus sendaiensis]
MSEAKYFVARLLKAIAEQLPQSPAYRALPLDERKRLAEREAEQIVAHALGWDRVKLLQSLGDEVPDEIAERAARLAALRVQGEPLAYVLGKQDFYGRTFEVGPDCLIPRPDTEVLVEEAIRFLKRMPSGTRVIDVGTGSGCIAVSIALACPGVSVTAVDLSMDALAVARRNAERFGAVVDWAAADGIEWLIERAERGRPWHAIVSNPPYVPTGEIDQLEPSVRDYEPRLALDGGEDGLAFYRRMAALPPYVLARGRAGVFLEVGHNQADDVARLFAPWRERGFRVRKVKDLRGIDRVIAVTREPGAPGEPENL